MPTILGFLVAKRNSCIQQLGDIRRDPARVILSSRCGASPWHVLH